MEKLRADSVITGIETSGVTLRNQCHRFQLVIRSLQSWALYGLQVEVLGNLKPFVSLGVVDSVPSESIFIGKTDDYVLGGAGSYPDVIRPLKTGDLILPPNGNRCLWVRVEPNGELPVGNHRITFSVCDAEGNRLGETGYDLEVLPERFTHAEIKKTNWMHYDCICREYGVEAFSEGFYGVFEEFLRIYTQSGFNMLLTPIFTPPLDTAVGGERMTTQLVGVSVENGEIVIVRNHPMTIGKVESFFKVKIVLNVLAIHKVIREFADVYASRRVVKYDCFHNVLFLMD